MGVFPDLVKNYISDISFDFFIEYPLNEIREFFIGKGFKENINQDGALLYSFYKKKDLQHAIVLQLRNHKSDPNKGVIDIEIFVQENLIEKLEKNKLKEIDEKLFIDFFVWMSGLKKLVVSKICVTSHANFPIGEEYQPPPLLEAQEDKSIYLTGLRFGFDEKLGIDTVIVEREKSEKHMYFMIKTLRRFRLDAKLFNEKFFDIPIEFVLSIGKKFCNKLEVPK